jgi:flagellar hook-associated protein 3 FlgL
MRIATSTVFENQTASIDNAYATYQLQGQELSTGKSLNAPSDNPTQIAQDLTTRNDNSVQTQEGKNFSDLSNQLTSVDGALSSLTNVMQSARSLAVEGASDTINASQRNDIATQVDQLLQEAIGIANTQYNGKYVFSGTNVPPTTPLVRGVGSPITSVSAVYNLVQSTQQLPNGSTVPTNVTLQQAFNFNATNGSPSVFQSLINLRDTLRQGQVVDESVQRVNLLGTTVTPATTLAALSTGAVPQIMGTPLTPDSAGNYTINIANGTNLNGVNVTLLPADTITTMLGKINAAANPMGINAAFNVQTQRLTFTSTTNPPATFEIQNVPSAGANNTSNFLTAFNLFQQATTTGYVSTQIGDFDNALQATLNARAVLGSTIQSVQRLGQTSASQVLNDTAVQSGIEDTDIAKVTSDFSRTQTVLQAAYATTTRLEGKTLFDYL